MTETPSLAEIYRAAPVRTLLFTAVPVALALAQLFNAFVTSFPVWAAAIFAATMLAATISLFQYHRAEVHVGLLERELREAELRAPGAD